MNHESKRRKAQTACKKINCNPGQSSRIFTGIKKYVTLSKMDYTLSGIQSKITKPAEKQKDLMYDERHY